MPVCSAREHSAFVSVVVVYPSATASIGCPNVKIAARNFKKYPIGYFCIDIAEVRTEEGKLFVAIDRTSKFAYVELVEKAGRMQAAEFLRNLTAKVPYKIHKILTDNGVQFTNLARNKKAPQHIFDRVCVENEIEHGLTAPLWTNGQVERMNDDQGGDGTSILLRDARPTARASAGVHRCIQSRRRLKTLDGLTPWEFITKQWTIHPESFKIKPALYNMGPYIQAPELSVFLNVNL